MQKGSIHGLLNDMNCKLESELEMAHRLRMVSFGYCYFTLIASCTTCWHVRKEGSSYLLYNVS